MTLRLAVLAVSLPLAACAAGPKLSGRDSTTVPAPAPASTPKEPKRSASHAPPASPSVSPESAEVWSLPVEQVLGVPVRAVALGEGSRVAALADPPYVGDARGLRPLALPASLRPKAGEVDQAGIYFGRDNEPRIMGQRRSEQGESAIYWRHLPNGWRDGREEIGQLGGTTRGALWGVLGGDDPELVCRTGAICIIKRQSGWTTAPAGETQRIVTLQDGALWGLDASGVASIDKQGWRVVLAAPAWSNPRALWATPGEAWVGAHDQLFHAVAATWQASPSPVGEVESFWGTRRDSIWIAGSSGAAHFDGQRWRTLPIRGPLHAVRGRSNGEVWFGGDAGLFRVQAP